MPMAIPFDAKRKRHDMAEPGANKQPASNISEHRQKRDYDPRYGPKYIGGDSKVSHRVEEEPEVEIAKQASCGYEQYFGSFHDPNLAATGSYGSANATYESPAFVASFPAPPQAITTYCRPLTMYVQGVA